MTLRRSPTALSRCSGDASLRNVRANGEACEARPATGPAQLSGHRRSAPRDGATIAVPRWLPARTVRQRAAGVGRQAKEDPQVAVPDPFLRPQNQIAIEGIFSHDQSEGAD